MLRMLCSCLYLTKTIPAKYTPEAEPDPEKRPHITWENTEPFVPPITHGEVIKVYDGDTITIASKLPYAASPLYRFSVRLAGIDSAEIKGKTEREKTMAQEAKNALQNLILHRVVTLKNITTEKYGRLLADVYIDGIHVNKWLLENNYAIAYSGGTKANWV